MAHALTLPQLRGISFPTFRPPDFLLLGRRVLAFFFDWFIGTRLAESMIEGLLLYPFTGNLSYDSTPYLFHIYREFIILLYFMGSWMAPWRATPGMLICQLQVVNQNKQTLSFKAALLRYFLFSLWFLYYNRRGMILFAQVDMEATSLAEMETFIENYNSLFNLMKHGLMFILFIIPYVLIGRTLPDYASGARVIFRHEAGKT